MDTVAEERRFEPYVQAIAARSDLNYIFQEMLGGFSVGHLRGNGGVIPRRRRYRADCWVPTTVSRMATIAFRGSLPVEAGIRGIKLRWPNLA
jgi:hypothetical protein